MRIKSFQMQYSPHVGMWCAAVGMLGPMHASHAWAQTLASPHPSLPKVPFCLLMIAWPCDRTSMSTRLPGLRSRCRCHPLRSNSLTPTISARLWVSRALPQGGTIHPRTCMQVAPHGLSFTNNDASSDAARYLWMNYDS